MSAQAEIGPVLLPRGVVYRMANEIGRRAMRMRELASPGACCDLAAAQRELEAIHALSGCDRAANDPGAD